MFEMTTHTTVKKTPPPAAAQDRTRAKLLAAAGEAFAEYGYHDTTVREICLRAGANVAAVNYHFGDKLSLYTEVLRGFARRIDVEALVSEPGIDPEVLLRRIIQMRFRGVFATDQPDVAFRVMMHEWARPTPAMDRVVDETFRPLYNRFREIVGAILDLPPDHETTRLCVHSVIGQAIHYVHGRPILKHLWPELTMTPDRVDRIAAHIADFSLAYLREVASHRAGGARRRERSSP
jgi:AcrR family transcriptional regulator